MAVRGLELIEAFLSLYQPPAGSGRWGTPTSYKLMHKVLHTCTCAEHRAKQAWSALHTCCHKGAHLDWQPLSALRSKLAPLPLLLLTSPCMLISQLYLLHQLDLLQDECQEGRRCQGPHCPVQHTGCVLCWGCRWSCCQAVQGHAPRLQHFQGWGLLGEELGL